MKSFKLGIQKAREAIDNAIGSKSPPAATKQQSKMKERGKGAKRRA